VERGRIFRNLEWIFTILAFFETEGGGHLGIGKTVDDGGISNAAWVGSTLQGVEIDLVMPC